MADIFDIPAKDPAELNMTYYWDTYDNNETGVSYYTLTDNDIQLYASYTDLNTKDLDNNIDSHKTALLLGTDPYQDVIVEITSKQWIADDALKIDTVELSLSFNLKSARFAIATISRSIELKTINEISIESINLNSEGIKFDYDYYGLDNWVIALSYSEYQYSKDVTLLATKPLLQLILNPASYSLATGFERNSTSLHLSKTLKSGTFGIIFTSSRSAIDDSKLDSYSIEWQHSLGNEASILLSIGQSAASATNTKYEFYNISLAHYFY